MSRVTGLCLPPETPGHRTPDQSTEETRLPTTTAARTAGPTLTVGLVAGALIGCSLPVFLLSALSSRIGVELSLSEAALGLAVSAFFLAGAVGSLPAGLIADRFGASVALRTGLLIVTAGGAGVALTANDGVGLAAWLMVAGLSIGFVDTGGARAIAAVVPLDRHGIAFGAKEASIPAASLVAGVSVPVLGEQVGWRPAFVAAAVLALLLGLALPSGLDRSDRRSRAREAGYDLDVDEPAEAAGVVPPGSDDDAPSVTDELAVRGRGVVPGDGPRDAAGGEAPTGERSSLALIALAVTAALGGGAAMAGATFLVPSTVTYGWGETPAGLLLAIASAAGIVVRLLVGVIADRRRDGELRILAIAILVGAVGALGLATGSVAIAIPAAVLTIGGGWGWTGLLFLAAVRTAPTAPARAAGTVLVGLGLGGAGGPLSFGWIAGSAGYRAAWLVAAGALTVGAVLALTAERIRHRSNPRT